MVQKLRSTSTWRNDSSIEPLFEVDRIHNTSAEAQDSRLLLRSEVEVSHELRSRIVAHTIVYLIENKQGQVLELHESIV